MISQTDTPEQQLLKALQRGDAAALRSIFDRYYPLLLGDIYRLIPDEKGNVQVYKKFWHTDDDNTNAVPPLLAYTDLVNTNDRRCMETAQKIYDAFLQNQF